ncbi:hypothetical protein F9C07_5361 [Aspergillus flavus]|uniref:Uncharacterized protein n=1 Tax=Aspergillus flavus (strain ATCC 200026 / FGSC A1120 / IAM 13836 / NRRL 3357 / JCM 12722 / SRRC 167) TaxID=332952 RepID=A0A7U2MWS8_ASPFN|nr:hypothetical protein F9C07_5361 [Aspergillus flavus]
MPMLMGGYRTHGMTQYSTETHGQVECIGGRPRRRSWHDVSMNGRNTNQAMVAGMLHPLPPEGPAYA